MPNYTLGKAYTVSGLAGVTDLTVTFEGERIDVTTRKVAKPIKLTAAGFPDMTFECTVLATGTTTFSIGKAYPVTLNGAAFADMICMSANREEPQVGVINYKLTLKPGLESEVADQIAVGPGTYRTTT